MSRSRGFTLIEIMIVVLIIGILAAIALTAYQRQVTESRRKAGTACLIEASHFMERFYTTNLRYDQDAGGTAFALPQLQCMVDLVDYYAVTVAAVAQRTYTLQAAPIGVQATRDTACATLSVTQAGIKTESGTSTAADCW